MPKYNFAILKNETKSDHLLWTDACRKYPDEISYDIIDLSKADWFENITKSNYDLCLLRPPGSIAYYKQLYDERVYIINKILNLPVYPHINEVLVYENKRFLAYYLKAMQLPHPETMIFYTKDEAMHYASCCEMPVVAKTNIGASGTGVKIIKNKSDLYRYIEKVFSNKGIKRYYLPNFRRGDYLSRLKKRLLNVNQAVEYFIDKHRAATVEPQKWFALFQEYIQTDYEWRCVVIGDSYFGHKKLKSFGDKISGTSKVSWEIPDEKLLYFLKDVMEKTGFCSQAIDLFFHKEKGFLINEMQCFWGSKNSHQMIRDGSPGRLIFRNGNWAFEEGEFNQNNSYDLRLRHALSLIGD